jgi:hypothetical protein
MGCHSLKATLAEGGGEESTRTSCSLTCTHTNDGVSGWGDGCLSSLAALTLTLPDPTLKSCPDDHMHTMARTLKRM